MNTGSIIGLFTVFTIIWGGGLWVVDTRNDARSITMRDSLMVDIKNEVGKYQNVYTLEDVISIVNSKYLEGFQDIKIYMENDKNLRDQIYKAYVLEEKSKFDFFILEDFYGKLTLMQVIERKDTVPLIKPYLKIN